MLSHKLPFSNLNIFVINYAIHNGNFQSFSGSKLRVFCGQLLPQFLEFIFSLPQSLVSCFLIHVCGFMHDKNNIFTYYGNASISNMQLNITCYVRFPKIVTFKHKTSEEK